MANYNSNFTDELRARLSVVDVVGRHVPLTKKGLNYWGCCPFHNEKTPSFSVNEEKGFYHCFGCGEHGDIISFTMKLNNLDFKEAIKELATQAGLQMPDYKPKSPAQISREESYIEITSGAEKIYQQKLFEPDGKKALDYIRGRGFTDEMITRYGIGYAPRGNIIANKFVNIKQDVLLATGLCRRGDYGMYDFFRDKLMFPIFNASGQIVAFSGRSMDGSEPKYINTTDTEMFHKRNTVFGLNFARDAIHRANRTIIVEGQIDAIRMQCNGFPETVAPLGTSLTEEHIAKLCKLNRNIVFCFDGDAAGQKAAGRAADIVMPFLRDNSEIKFAFVTGGKDPDEVIKTAGRVEMEKIINSAVSLVDFLWELTNKNFVVSTPGGRAQAEKFLDAKIEKITDNDLKREYIQEYNSRKFNTWHKWKKGKQTENIPVPEIDTITKNTLIFIVNKYPEIAEQYAEFLSGLNILFDENCPELNMNTDAAEKYIRSLQLQKTLETLHIQKKIVTSKMLNGDAKMHTELQKINNQIVKLQSELEQVVGL